MIKESNINLKDWNNETKKNTNIILAHICAFWTLHNMEKINLNKEKKPVYKSLHATQIFALMILLGFHTFDNIIY